MIKITIEGADKLIRKLNSLESMSHVTASIQMAGVYLKGKVADYPRASSRPNPQIKTNPKMRRGFFYHLNHGDIEVPYRRGVSPGSKKLSQSWTVRSENGGWRAIVGTGVSYARLVQDSEKQTLYHKTTGWITTKDVVRLYGDDAVEMIRTALRKEISV